jgi:hypothetical protein
MAEVLCPLTADSLQIKFHIASNMFDEITKLCKAGLCSAPTVVAALGAAVMSPASITAECRGTVLTCSELMTDVTLSTEVIFQHLCTSTLTIASPCTQPDKRTTLRCQTRFRSLVDCYWADDNSFRSPLPVVALGLSSIGSVGAALALYTVLGMSHLAEPERFTPSSPAAETSDTL